MSKHQNFTGSVRAYIVARPGQFFQAHQLAKQFGVDVRTIRNALVGLTRSMGGIRETVIMGKRHWYFPTAEQTAAMNAPALVARPFKPYVVPQQMQELTDRIRAEREAVPSHYGSGTPQQWKAREA